MKSAGFRFISFFALIALASTAVFSSTASAGSLSAFLFGSQSAHAAASTGAPFFKPAVFFSTPTAPVVEDNQPQNNDIATVTTDRTDYKPGETVVITGSGFRVYEPITIKIDREGVEAASLQATSDGNGNFINRQFIIGTDDVGASFVVKATGVTSGKTAQSVFTDGTMSYTPGGQNFIGGSAIVSGTSASFSQTVTSPGATSPPPCSAVFSAAVSTTPNSVNLNGNNTTPFPAGFIVSTNPGSVQFNSGVGGSVRTWTVSIQVPVNTTPGFYSAEIKATPSLACHSAGIGTQVVIQVKAPAPTDTTAPMTIVDSGTYINNSWTNQNVTVNLSADDNTGGVGMQDLSYTVTGPNNVSATTNVVSSPFTASIPVTAEGTTTIQYFAKDTLNNTEATKTFYVNIDKTAPVLSLPGNISVQADDANGKVVSFNATATDRAPSTLNATCLPASGSLFAIGTTPVNCSATDDVGNVSNGSFSVEVTKAGQSITFGALGGKTYGDADFPVSATTTGTGLAVTFSADGNCTVTNGMVHITGAGSCTITASQAGSNEYLPAISVPQSFNISQKSLTASIVANNKVYNGNTAATFSCTVAVKVGTDDVGCAGGTATFDTKNVGTGKTVTATGLSLSGANSANYSLPVTTATGTANIAAATVNGSFTADNKVYDGNNTATILTRTISSGKVGTEDVTLADGSATFDDKNVGTGKTVTGSGFTLDGADAGNYQLGEVATTTANITKKGLNINGAVANNKVYDGGKTATVSFTSATLSGVIGSEAVTVNSSNYAALFDTKDVGTNKAVTVTGVALGGDDASNYSVSQPSGLKANITALHITGSFTADHKIYDRTTTAIVASRSLNGAVNGDVVSLTGGTATFSDKNVGTGKTVTLADASLSGTDAGNYILDSVNTTTANITAKTVACSITADNKIFDGNTTATILTRSLTGVISPDVVECVGGTATFDTAFTGTGKTVTATGLSISGTDVGNYVLNPTTASTTANIGAWTLRGFYQPVEMSIGTTIVWNTVKNGSTVPLKFNVFAGTTEKTSTTEILSFQQGVVPCELGGIEDVVDLTTTGGTSLRYSGTPGIDGQFVQNWQTPKQAGRCYKVVVTTKDGSQIPAFFKLK